MLEPQSHIAEGSVLIFHHILARFHWEEKINTRNKDDNK
jgi:hypothetical protein